MELHQLRCFVAVAEELHFGRAATRLHMTQPPLSRQIQLLEHSLGVLLLERNNRQARLTLAGQSFLEDARRILHIAETASHSARRIAHGEAGRLTLGFTAVGAYSMIPRLLVHAGKALPDIELMLSESVSSTQVHDLEASLIDIGLVRQVLPSARVEYVPIHREPFVAALPAGHPLSSRERLRPEDFDGQPFIMYSAGEGRYLHDRITNLFARHEVQPRYLHRLGQTHSVLGLVNVGLGCAVVPASAQALRLEQVVFRPLLGMEQQAEIFLAYCRDNPNPVLGAFVAMARGFFEAG
ncbi:LysR family transcriptional regulator [Pseudomonas putida]|uniref:LysR substrate-binding domain-containing protein n=1 Tax=Pseudomonas putida group TaxID=136845 RepID=UPI00105AA101|nr:MULTISPECIES: LysR substrate-binding domain-containing protein [Pseudomonas putida group]MBF8745814.1 LysR family transcriptional regulator [Pseudomonas monteilii]TDJ75130.1 LysR family transcriptional regulator [Pseudomonas putida]